MKIFELILSGYDGSKIYYLKHPSKTETEFKQDAIDGIRYCAKLLDAAKAPEDVIENSEIIKHCNDYLLAMGYMEQKFDGEIIMTEYNWAEYSIEEPGINQKILGDELYLYLCTRNSEAEIKRHGQS